MQGGDRPEAVPSPDASASTSADWMASLHGSRENAAKLSSGLPPQSDSASQILPGVQIAQLESELSRGPQKFDASALLQKDRVVFFGERHDDLSEKDDVIANLPSMKDKAGLTHVAMEMLNDADMPYVRAYLNGTGSREQVLERLKERWSVAPGVPEKYMEMIDAMKRLHLTPVALDVVESGGDDHGDSTFQTRNDHWAKVIGDLLKSNPAAKVLVYSGRDHAGYDAQRDHSNEILQDEYGVHSEVVVFSSPLDPPATLPGKLAQSAKALGHRGDEFYLKIAPLTTRPGDYLLYPKQKS